ncbi:MAG: SulP family inorganic anion transporter [Planctomycetota bacterium]
MLLNYFRAQTATAKADILSGLTVALALVPEAVAFAFVAGVDPLIGLYSAFFIGLIAAVIGGRPGMISGATGAMAVVVVALVAEHGVTYLFPAVILCGLIQCAVGIGRLGKLIRIVPLPVMLGFVNGLAIVIGAAQLGSFQTLAPDGTLAYMTGAPLIIMLALVAATMLIIWGLPKLTTAVPSSLVAILAISFAAAGLNAWSPASWAPTNSTNVTPTVSDMLATNLRANEVKHALHDAQEPAKHDIEGIADTAGLAVSFDAGGHGDAHATPSDLLDQGQIDAAIASVTAEDASLAGGVPELFFLDAQYAGLLPPFTLETLIIIAPYALILAGVGLIESLMTMTLIDEITETRGKGNRECVGQGIANITCGLFGGMGGCAMIGQSLINTNSGGRGRLSGAFAAVMLLAFILFLAPAIQLIPMAALVGVMFMVVIGTFEWATLHIWRKIPIADFFVMLLVTGYTVFMHDLATAVILGTAVAALVFAWRHATHVFADAKYNKQGSKIYQLHGPLFFASVPSFKELFHPKTDPPDVVLDFYYTRVYDQSALEAINAVAEKYRAEGKRLHLTHLSPECRQLLGKAGNLVEVNLSEDPQYHVATDRLG